MLIIFSKILKQFIILQDLSQIICQFYKTFEKEVKNETAGNFTFHNL